MTLADARRTPALVRLGVALRPERDDDRDWTAALYASTRADELAPLGWPDAMATAFLRRQFELQQAHLAAHHPDADRLIVLTAGERAGRLVVDRTLAPWRLVDIALDPLHRGQGIGGALIGWLQREGRRTGIDLHVVHGNLGAARLYARLGFRPVESATATHARLAWPG